MLVKSVCEIILEDLPDERSCLRHSISCTMSGMRVLELFFRHLCKNQMT